MTDLSKSIVFPRSGCVSKNRVVLAAMTNKQSYVDGILSPEEINWLLLRAEGGFGMVTTAAAHVTQGGQSWDGEMGVWGDHQIDGLRKLAIGIKKFGALSLVQLFHGGMRAPEEITKFRPLSPSKIECSVAKCGYSQELTHKEILNLIQAFGDAARRCEFAGFDGIELHAAHGYLISQFLGKITNLRTDKWGGDVSSRASFLVEIIKDIKQKTSPNFIIGVRISPEIEDIGVELEDSLEVSEIITRDGIDFVHISCWDCFSSPQKYPSSPKKITTWFSELLENRIPIISTGSIWTVSDAEEVLNQGADLIGVARAAIGHSDWGNHIENPLYSPDVPPFSESHLRSQGLSDVFIEYMKRWKGFVENN